MTKKFTGIFIVLALFILTCASAAQIALPTAPVELSVPMPPVPFVRDGKINLVYEVHMTNLRPADLVLTNFEILNNGSSGAPVEAYTDKEIVRRMVRPVPALKLMDARMIEGGKRAVMYIWITLDRGAEIPKSLSHRLTLKPLAGSGPEQKVEGGRTEPGRAAKPIGPPLRGGIWAMRFSGNYDGHRRSFLTLYGHTFFSQRFAIDIAKIGDDGKYGRDDDTPENSDVYGYGAEVVAVADGVIARAKDGIPENAATLPSGALPNDYEVIYGNHIILDIGDGRSALYAHLQPGSFRVKAGDRVKKGQTIALLGNSGNSTGPHLHFQVNNAPVRESEGVPFVFDSFALLGMETMDQFQEGLWKADPAFKVTEVRNEMTPNMSVVRFPD
jgi:murein DD-endopeptidase